MIYGAAAGSSSCEVSAFVKQLLRKFLQIDDFRNRHQRKTAKMAVHEHRLSISVADDTNARLAQKLVQLWLESSAEIGVFEIVNTPEELARVAKGCHTATFCPKMRLIVCAVKKVSNTLLFLYCTKESTHCLIVNVVSRVAKVQYCPRIPLLKSNAKVLQIVLFCNFFMPFFSV